MEVHCSDYFVSSHHLPPVSLELVVPFLWLGVFEGSRTSRRNEHMLEKPTLEVDEHPGPEYYVACYLSGK